MNRDEKGVRGGRELRLHSVPTIAEQARISVEIVAILAAGLWALYTFVYEQRIKPLFGSAIVLLKLRRSAYTCEHGLAGTTYDRTCSKANSRRGMSIRFVPADACFLGCGKAGVGRERRNTYRVPLLGP